MKFRPASVPLITVDPFFSVWSCDDALYGGPTEHWSGRLCPIIAGIYVDDVFYSMSAFDCNGKAISSRVYQKSLEITPTSSVYEFENDFAKVKLVFTTPLLLNRLDVLCRPVSYVGYEIEKKVADKQIRFMFGISARACVDNKEQNVAFEKTDYSLRCGNVSQTPLSQSGDCMMIDWGYLHLCDKDAGVGRFNFGAEFQTLPIDRTYNAYEEDPFLFVVKNESKGVITLAYDEIKPIEYFGVQLDEYYTKFFDGFDAMAKTAVAEYDRVKALCDWFDKVLTAETRKFGDTYQCITSLAYRQAVSAHKLAEDPEGNLLFLSKENDSNGCIGTLDVTYPSIPLFLKYAPELVNGMLRPILKFALSDAWEFDFAPHDVGQYPLANGQVYGANETTGKLELEYQMPIEEIGNMFLCLCAVKKYSGKQTLFDEYRPLMDKWAEYLVKHGYDPENQLCTDDFAGHLARNCNLSLKAILGIASYSVLSGVNSYMGIANDYAKRWQTDAKANHKGTRLAFGEPDGWSIKYNIVWDDLLGFHLFSDEVKKKEVELYLSKLNCYGVPLDSRATYTKIDWLMWSTRIYKNNRYFAIVCQAIADMISETVDRVPLTDWYFTDTADFRSFRARSVVGGLFIHLLD